MCGIIGLLSYGKKSNTEENTRQEVMRFLTTELLIQTEERGKDATGISTLFNDGDFMCQKMGIPASEFVFRHGGKETDYNGYMKLWEDYDKPARIILAHCRKSSVGNTINNGNNHPVRVGNICVVHNGTLSNHHKIFENLGIKRDNDVDTEAIAQLLKHYTDDGKLPWTIESLKKVNEKLQGSFAVLAFNANNPYQLAVIRDTRPIDVCWIKPLDVAILVSNDVFVKTVLMKYKLMKEIYGKNHWPTINTSDVIMRSLNNMHLSIFNLLEAPKDVSGIDDIAEDVHVPYFHNSTWSSSSQYIHNANNSNKNDDDKEPPSKSSAVGFQSDYAKRTTATGDEKTQKVAGKVWNKELYKYTDVNENDIRESAKDGNSVINLNDHIAGTRRITDKHTYACLEQKEFASSELISNVKIIDLENGSEHNKPHNVLIDEHGVIEAKADSVDDLGTTDSKHGDTVSVNMSVDVEAMELASEGVRGVPKYDSSNDVCDALNIKDVGILGKLPVHSLANMIQSNSWKKGFMIGLRSGGKTSPVIKKDSQSTSNIRTLKAFVDITSSTIGKMMDESEFIHDTLANGIMEKIVAKNVKDKATDLTISRLNNVFSEGDKKNSPIIRNITEKVKAAQQEI